MKYLSKQPFSVPAGSSKIRDEDWEAIFGSEESRKQKLHEAAQAQRSKPKHDNISFPGRCGGGVGAGKVSSALPRNVNDLINQGIKKVGIPESMVSEVKNTTAARIKDMKSPNVRKPR